MNRYPYALLLFYLAEVIVFKEQKPSVKLISNLSDINPEAQLRLIIQRRKRWNPFVFLSVAVATFTVHTS